MLVAVSTPKRILVSFVSFLGAVFGIWLGYTNLKPQLSPDIGQLRDALKPHSADFIITNNSYFPLTHIEITCLPNSIKFESGDDFFGPTVKTVTLFSRDSIQPHEKFAFNCPQLAHEKN